MRPDNRNRTYFGVVSRRGGGENPFGRSSAKNQAMGVKVSEVGYRSDRAAQRAGSSALDQFLSDLSREAEANG